MLVTQKLFLVRSSVNQCEKLGGTLEHATADVKRKVVLCRCTEAGLAVSTGADPVPAVGAISSSGGFDFVGLAA